VTSDYVINPLTTGCLLINRHTHLNVRCGTVVYTNSNAVISRIGVITQFRCVPSLACYSRKKYTLLGRTVCFPEACFKPFHQEPILMHKIRQFLQKTPIP